MKATLEFDLNKHGDAMAMKAAQLIHSNPDAKFLPKYEADFLINNIKVLTSPRFDYGERTRATNELMRFVERLRSWSHDPYIEVPKDGAVK